MKNIRRSVRKTNTVNVSDLAKIVCGLDTKKNVKDMSIEQRRDFWCATKAFSQIARKYGCRYGMRPKTNGGVGMKLIQDFILAHA